MVYSVNYKRCTTCISGFFADMAGICQKLPPFCNQVDAQSRRCTQCSANGLMKGDSCVDKNCQIFDNAGSCLACLNRFQFGKFGECIPEVRDANCK